MRAPEFAILHQLDDAGPISQQALGRALRIHPSNLVAMIDELEDAGSLIRRRDPDDRRRYLLELTDEGGRRLGQAEAARSRPSRAALAAEPRPSASGCASCSARLAGHSCAPTRLLRQAR